MRMVHFDLSHIAVEQELDSREQRFQLNQKLRELVQIRGEVLSRQDQVFIEMILEKGMTHRQIACLLGCSETSVGRRVKRVIKKVLNSDYLMCLRHRDRLTVFQMRVARAYFVEDRSKKEIVGLLDTTLYQVEKAIDAIRRLRGVVSKRRNEFMSPDKND